MGQNHNNAEKRSYKRFSADDHCRARLDNMDDLDVKNISMFGACLVVPRPLEKESICDISVYSDKKGNIALKGSVIWSYPLGTSGDSEIAFFETGLKFLDMNDMQRETLKLFIDNLE